MDRAFVTSIQLTASTTSVVAGKDSYAMNEGRLADYQRWTINFGSASSGALRGKRRHKTTIRKL